jgi:hypothetical protein
MVVALIALVVALGGVGYATIPDSSGTIHACYVDRPYSRIQPLFRVIDTEKGQACRSNEVPLTWKDFEGAAAGGDLTGTYPNPTIGADKVSTLKVLNDSLQGVDINESTLVGVNADRLDGFDSTQLNSNTCFPGDTLVGPLCWGGPSPPRTLATAASFCSASGGRLPLLFEFMALMKSGVSVGNLADHWTGSSAGDDNTLYINNASNAENPDGARSNSTVGLSRCVRDPINVIGSP